MPRRERSRGIETATELVIGVAQRIGSVSPALGRWAASAGLSHVSESLGHRRGGQSKRKRSSLRRTAALRDRVPDFDSSLRIALVPQFGRTARHAGWFNRS